MDDDIKLLKEIFNNVESCQFSINKIMPKVKDDDFKNILERHLNEYNKINLSCEGQLFRKSQPLKNIKSINNKINNVGLEINLMFNNKNRNFADILIKENNSAIHNITKNIVEYQGADEQTKELANTLLKNDRNNIEELQKFI